MDRIERLFLNLAPESPRNKNPFRISLIFLILTILMFLYLDFLPLYKGITSYIKNENIIENLRKELNKISQENKELESKIIGVKKNYKKRVDTLNSLIEEKNLSWLSLLTIFEESLSDRTVLISLSPFSGSKNLTAEISSDNLDELLKTINRLSKNKLVSEVSIVREREKEGQKIITISIKLKD
jgi:cell division protein FtsB